MNLTQKIPMKNISDEEIPQEVIKKLPAKFVNRYQVIPIKMGNNTLVEVVKIVIIPDLKAELVSLNC